MIRNETDERLLGMQFSGDKDEDEDILDSEDGRWRSRREEMLRRLPVVN